MSFLALATALALLVGAHAQTCTLVENGTYIATNNSAISAMCDGDAASLSAWETYTCDYIRNRQEECWPQRWLSTCEPGQLKGVLLLFHGLSACPDQWELYASELVDSCFHVYTPLTIGHGYSFCNETADAGCFEGGYNVSQMPNTRAEYMAFTDLITEAMEEELQLIHACERAALAAYQDASFAVGGLSLGASLSATFTSRADAGLIDRQLLLNPYLGITYNTGDNQLDECTESDATMTGCLEAIFAGVGADDDEAPPEAVEALADLVLIGIGELLDEEKIDVTYDSVNYVLRDMLEAIVEEEVFQNLAPVQELLDTVYGWGEACIRDQGAYQRGGFCKFEVRDLLVGHSLGQRVRSVAADNPVPTLAAAVQRDGSTRNGLVAQYLQVMYDYDSAAYESAGSRGCVWPVQDDCPYDEVDNRCGVPHSSFSYKDNRGDIPYYLWWNVTHFSAATEWLKGGSAFPAQFLVPEDDWDLSREQCLEVDMMNSSSTRLLRAVPQPIEIVFNAALDVFAAKVKADLLDAIADKTGVPRGVLEVTAVFAEKAAEETVLALQVPDEAVPGVVRAFASGELDEFVLDNVVIPLGSVDGPDLAEYLPSPPGSAAAQFFNAKALALFIAAAAAAATL